MSTKTKEVEKESEKTEKQEKKAKVAKARKEEKAETAAEAKQATQAKQEKCTDKKCPFHAGLSVRGRSFVGEITRKRDKTVKVEWLRFKRIPKYERYAKVKSGVFAHLPECISSFDIGDKVKISECRPLSRTKHFVVVGRELKGNKRGFAR